MKNKVFRILAVLSAICFILAGCGEKIPTSANLKATDKLFVNDFADVISDSDEEVIYNKGVYLNGKTTAQVAVVTVNTTGDEEIADYALNLGRNWELGDKEKDNGIVVLLSVEDREVYIAVGYGLEGALPDSKTGRILDTYGIPYFSEDEFSKGLVSVYNAIYNEVLIEYGISPDQDYVPIDRISSINDAESSKIVISWVVLVIVILLYILIFKRKGLFLFMGGPPSSGFGGGFSGGFGGGSSFGGGFRGGGGSFGGGGAGRGF